MINWEELYWKLCDTRKEIGVPIHKHHLYPRFINHENKDTVKLSFRNHVLAHYIRYRWLLDKKDRLSVQILIRENIPKQKNEIKYKVTKKIIEPPVEIIPPKKPKKKRILKYKELIQPNTWIKKPMSDKKLRDSLRRKFFELNPLDNVI